MTTEDLKVKHILINNFERISTVQRESEDFLTKHPDIREKLSNLVYAYRILENLPNPVSMDVFPLCESYMDLEASVQHCLMGYYKQAQCSLRSALELGLLSLYWVEGYQTVKQSQRWVRSIENTPDFQKIVTKLCKHKNAKQFCKYSNLGQESMDIYNRLSDFSHTKGRSYSHIELARANFNRFSENALRAYVDSLEQVVKLVCKYYLLIFPVSLQFTPVDQKFGIDGPIGIFIDPFDSDSLKNIFDEQTAEVLQKISDSDVDAKSLAGWLNNRPDITEEELKQQLIDFDKFQIENEGWETWIGSRSELYEHYKESSPDSYERFLSVRKELEAWARENNFLKPRWERIQEQKHNLITPSAKSVESNDALAEEKIT